MSRRKPVLLEGWVIIGGLLTSTALVLLIVPILYQLFTREEKQETILA